MTAEYTISVDGGSHTVLVSDDPKALLAAKAAGRAFVGVEGEDPGHLAPAGDIPFRIPSFEDASPELARLVLLRHLGKPWIIGETKRLVIRELTGEDAGRIPAGECSGAERVFACRELLEAYISRQYGFYEYGTWAVTRREDGALLGLAGVTNPDLPPELERHLEAQGPGRPWLELGYRIFAPFRRQGFGREALEEILAYSHQVLEVRLCAVIAETNTASRALAGRLGLVHFMREGEKKAADGTTEAADHRAGGKKSPAPVTVSEGEGPGRLLLYGENWT